MKRQNDRILKEELPGFVGAQYATVGRNPSEEMEWPSCSTKECKMQYLDAILNTTE